MKKPAATVFFLGILGLVSQVFAQSFLSNDWLNQWNNPPVQMRPLQIVHGNTPADQQEERLKFLKNECGLGGIVCNFEHTNYLTSETGWENFIKTVETAKQLGLRVWIYDEDGYPSPAAGGLVIQNHPEFESLELVYDASNPENPYIIRDCYEFTHAANNFYALRRYPNVTSDAAMERFLTVTHREYAKRLTDAGLFDVVEAFFTDEPSLNAFNTGEITKKVHVRVQDEPNPEKKNLPMIPWNEDFPKIYQEMYGEDLLAARKSLFMGDSPEDRKVRRQFWNMAGKMYENAFMGKIGRWCAENGKCSSGHALREESLLYHVPCYGNYFAGTRTMQLAGMDFLNNQPLAARFGWRTAIYPSSSNIMNGQRRMMTEDSDHSERLNLERNATLEEMELTAGWQMALGCTEFTLYYASTPETASRNRPYCDFVGRLNSILRDASIVKRGILYYPCRDLQEEYRPIAEKLTLETQSQRMQAIIASYYAHGQAFMEGQIPFMAADDLMLNEAEIVKSASGKAFLKLGNQSQIEILSIPAGVELPENVVRLVSEFRDAGGCVLNGDDLPLEPQLPKILNGNDTKNIVLGEFEREGSRIYTLSNARTEGTFTGTLTVSPTARKCTVFDPSTGEKTEAPLQNGTISIQIPPMKTLVWVLQE